MTGYPSGRLNALVDGKLVPMSDSLNRNTINAVVTAGEFLARWCSSFFSTGLRRVFSPATAAVVALTFVGRS